MMNRVALRWLMLCAVLAIGLGVWAAAGAEEGETEEPEQVPTQPTGLSHMAYHDSVILNWDDPDDASITHYEVWRRARNRYPWPEFVALTLNTGSAAASFTDTSVSPRTQYDYRVRAVNAQGQSAFSRRRLVSTARVPLSLSPVADDANWSATLTPETWVGSQGQSALAYSVWTETGELSSTAVAGASEAIEVQILALYGVGPDRLLYLGLSRRLNPGTVLVIGEREYILDDSPGRSDAGTWLYSWPETELQWTAGTAVDISLTLLPIATGEGVARVTVPVSVQVEMLTAELEQARTTRAALQQALDSAEASTGNRSRRSAQTQSLRDLIARFDVYIDTLVAVDTNVLVPTSTDLPYVTVDRPGDSDGDGIAFSKFTYRMRPEANEESTSIGVDLADPTQFFLWGDADSSNVENAFRQHTRPSATDLYRWTGENSLYGFCDAGALIDTVFDILSDNIPLLQNREQLKPFPIRSDEEQGLRRWWLGLGKVHRTSGWSAGCLSSWSRAQSLSVLLLRQQSHGF